MFFYSLNSKKQALPRFQVFRACFNEAISYVTCITCLLHLEPLYHLIQLVCQASQLFGQTGYFLHQSKLLL
ncbi:hypothetical protein DN757_12770 [Paenibacillus silvae]|uniref:Uncharacterized protein n=1 Tax=Paenibacillus silvae TaxID=1325358 RepID=A0A2W6PAY0_9BACL|nr:hypothetical protein DN757_12770 [Paenibacillus silvae]